MFVHPIIFLSVTQKRLVIFPLYSTTYNILAFSSEAFATSRYFWFQKWGQMGKEKRAKEIHTLTIVGSHLLFVNSDMWPPITTFKLGEARTKQTQMLWSPWVGDEQVLWRWGAFLSKCRTSLYSEEFRKAKNISKGALSSFLESWQTHNFFDSLQTPSGARRELCCCWFLATELTSLEWIKSWCWEG